MVKGKGNLLNVLNIRELQHDCLVLRAEQAPKVQREYQAVLKVDPVNFPLMTHEEQARIVEGFRVFLTGLTPVDRTLCIHLRIQRYDIEPYLAQLTHTAQTHPQPQYREQAVSHRQFVQQLSVHRALLRREFYVRVSLVINTRDRHYQRLSKEEVRDQAHTELTQKVADVMDGLSRAGLTSSRLSGDQLVQYYLSCIHTSDAEEYGLPQNVLSTLDYPIQPMLPHLLDSIRPASDQRALVPDAHHLQRAIEEHSSMHSQQRRRIWQAPHKMKWQRRRRGRITAKQQTALPDWVSLPELVQPASVEHTPHYLRVHHQHDEYVRGRTVIGYPAYALAGWVDQLLAIDEPGIDVLLFLETLDPTRFVRSLSRKLTGFHATQLLEARQGKTADPYIAAARDDVDALRSKLVSKTEQVHAFSLYMLTRAESASVLRERDQKVAQHLKSLELHSVALEYEHLQAWRSCVNGRDILHRARKLDTSTIACSFPFCSSNLSTEAGALVGLTPSGGLVLIDPTSSQLENGHELVFAKSGSGKSFYEKLGLMRYLLLGMEGIVIDPDDEFGRICDRFGGSHIALSPGQLHINPFDLGTSRSEANTLKEKVESLLVLFDLLLAEKDPGVLPQKERSYLHKMITRAYADRGILPDPSTHDQPAPNMQAIYDLILQDGDPLGLSDRLLRHLSSFPETTDVQLDNQLVVFDLKRLKHASDEMLRIGLYLIIEFVWGVVRRERTPKPRLLLIDEAWVLMEFLEGGNYLAGLSRGARKENLHLRMVTQNVNDFLASKAGQTILLNSAMKVLLHHDATTLDTITRAFQLSEEERRFLETAPKGQGLFFCRSSHVPIMVVASDDEYHLA
ncbi:MAG: hypothetical protein J2P37_09325, partial [Ktedonobacteraceae bacterium]|nr:hypothetical protein [Ktedonobacteraceae bacterium]